MKYKKIVVLTGAGISAESGLKTFRGNDGLWEGHRVEDVATPEAFRENPGLVHEFYNLRRAQLAEVVPNDAHLALAKFEQSFSGDFSIITQNVDDLHERAGSKNIFHMHGELRKARCLNSGKIYSWNEDLSEQTPHPELPDQLGKLRPHICWFGEIPFFMEQIQDLIAEADLFVAIGTSGLVYPAAALVNLTQQACQCVLINKEQAYNGHQFSEHISGNASEAVPDFFKLLKL